MPAHKKKIDRHLRRITRLNLALAIVGLLVVGALYAWLQWGVGDIPLPSQPSIDTATSL